MKLPRHAEIWLAPYLAQRLGQWVGASRSRVKRVWFTIADHFEPYWHNTDDQLARERVDRWLRLWPAIAARHVDSTGRCPQYCFFYPEEEFRPHLMDSLASLVKMGVGDVEIHLHHDGDTEPAFLERMAGFVEKLHRGHGLLRRHEERLVFGFIHGNWCLDNSRPDGRWCGLNNEITLLKQLGCYADFTMPCGPLPMQARTLNTIYWAVDDPARPKSYDRGPRAGRAVTGDLLMIPGPFGWRYRERLMPRMETGEIAANDPPTDYRVKRWLDLAPVVGDDCFVKVYTHGTQEMNSRMLLEGGLEQMFISLRAECARRGWALHYATAWQMRQAVDRAMDDGGV